MKELLMAVQSSPYNFEVSLSLLAPEDIEGLALICPPDDGYDQEFDAYLIEIDGKNNGEVYWEAATNPHKLNFGYDEEVNNLICSLIRKNMPSLHPLFLPQEMDGLWNHFIFFASKGTPSSRVVGEFYDFVHDAFDKPQLVKPSPIKRKAMIISEDNFRNMIKPYVDEDGDLIMCELCSEYPKVYSDLYRVDFDFEATESNDEKNLPIGKGFCIFSNDLVFYGATSQSEDELPVYYILYFDGRTLRAYIPEKGNLFNPKTRAAYKRDDLEDIALADGYSDFEEYSEAHAFGKFNWTLIEKDILNCIEVH